MLQIVHKVPWIEMYRSKTGYVQNSLLFCYTRYKLHYFKRKSGIFTTPDWLESGHTKRKSDHNYMNNIDRLRFEKMCRKL